jgi:hypothetical protein
MYCSEKYAKKQWRLNHPEYSKEYQKQRRLKIAMQKVNRERQLQARFPNAYGKRACTAICEDGSICGLRFKSHSRKRDENGLLINADLCRIHANRKNLELRHAHQAFNLTLEKELVKLANFDGLLNTPTFESGVIQP